MAKLSKRFVRGLVLVILMSCLLIQSETVKADWTMFRHDPAHSGVGTGNPVLTPTLQWTFNVTTASNITFADGWSSPAVVNGVVYIGESGYYTQNQGHYVDQHFLLGAFYALNVTNGAIIWSTLTTSNTIRSDFESGPAVVDGVVYVGSGVDLFAFNATDGSELWNYTTGASIRSSPAVTNGVVYIGSVDKNVYALNTTNGQKIWNYTTDDAIESSPAVDNGILYVGSLVGNFYALNATDGQKIWSYNTGNSIVISPSVANGIVYLGSNDYTLYAMNATSGGKLWNYTTGGYLSDPAVLDSVVYVGSRDHNVYAINSTTGSKLWNFTAKGSIGPSSPAITGGVIYIGSNDETLYDSNYALNASNGAELWNYSTVGYMFSSPAVTNGVLYFGASEVYALGVPSSSSPSPSPTIPEFSWLAVIPLLVGMLSVAIVLRRRRKTVV